MLVIYKTVCGYCGELKPYKQMKLKTKRAKTSAINGAIILAKSTFPIVL